MFNSSRRQFHTVLLASLLALSSQAQAAPSGAVAPHPYPDHPIEFVVAYTPGSANDILVRIIAPALGQALGQSVIVVNKPGAGGTLGTGYAAKANPDGYTVTLGSTATLAINRALFPDAGYDPLTAFQPVIPFATTPNILIVPANAKSRTVAELQAEAAGHPLNYSSSGTGTTQHLAGVLFERALKAGSAQHVPFRGPAEQVAAVAGGQVDFAFASLPSALPLIRSGKVRALGVTPLRRLDALADVPTLQEAGLRGFDRASVWFGLVAPAATPSDRIKTLYDAARKALADPAIQAKLAQAGYAAAEPLSISAYTAYVKEQAAFWGDLVTRSGARAD